MVNAKEWLRRAHSITRSLKKTMRRLNTLSDEYADARDAAYASDLLKEKIDNAYKTIVEKKETFCQMQAGGRRWCRTKKMQR